MSYFYQLKESLNKPLSFTTGIIILLSFAFILFLKISPVYLSAPPTSDEIWIKSINSGKPFYLEGQTIDEKGLIKSIYVPYYKAYGDYGLPLTVSLIAKTFSYIPFLKDHFFNGRDIIIVYFVLFLLSSIVFLLPKLPLFLTLGSQVALLFSITQINWGFPEARSFSGMAVVTCAVLLAALIFANENKKLKLTFISLGLMAGWLQLWRQTNSSIFLVTFFFIFIAIFIPIVINFIQVKQSKNKFIFKMPNTFKAFSYCFITFILIKLFVVLLYSTIYNHKLSFTTFPKHGSGLPLYLSLGYSKNPYNIAWEDDVGTINYRVIYDKDISYDEKFQNDLNKEFRRIVLEDPFLFFQNIFHKSKQLHSYLMKSELTLDNDLDITAVTPKKFHRILYILSSILLSFYIIWFFTNKKVSWEHLTLFIGGLGILLASLAEPLVVFPGYYASTLGLFLAIIFILLPCFLSIQRKNEKEQTIFYTNIGSTSINMYIMMICLSTASIPIIYSIIRVAINNYNAKQLVSDNNPIETIHKLNYQYGYLFNRLSLNEQTKIIDKLKNIKGHQNVLCQNDYADKESLFSPVCTIIFQPEGKQYTTAHLITYLSKDRNIPFPKSDQGPANSFISISKGTCDLSKGFLYDHDKCLYQRIPDANWDNKYHFITVTASKKFTENLTKINISPWNMVRTSTKPFAVLNEKMVPDVILNKRY